MPNFDRRQFLAGGAAAAAVGAFLPVSTTAAPEKKAPRNKLALATYSYWHFTRNKYPIEKVIEHAAELGVEGVDVPQAKQLDSSSVLRTQTNLVQAVGGRMVD